MWRGQLAPTWSQARIAATPMEDGQTRGCDKRGGLPAPNSRWVPNKKWAHLNPIFAPNTNNPKMAKRTPGPKLAKRHSLPLLNHGLWKLQEATSSFIKTLTLNSGATFPLSMYPVPKDTAVVHIWYNIPLCTIFSQRSKFDVLKTQICHINSIPQINHPL
ncbi:hypothetical protein O181_121137 [Austropuccinia psidii MF-1]|uniref:Uncharacterized protein n=1 Tax=Austropuccinia psidii MF-1 TaxID=1389203 RepID=A0A9Q3Q341_9BASI|nr:hypothetical protein [Austropuccinia psidii MF-1]